MATSPFSRSGFILSIKLDFKKTFRRGVHPKGMKHPTSALAAEEFPTGQYLSVPLIQHIGAPTTPVVAVGDKVRAGTKIALNNGNFSASIHSPVSGTVRNIVFNENHQGVKIRHIVIENDGYYETFRYPKLDDPTPKEIVARIMDAGIVGMGGAAFPLHIKITPNNDIKALIINAAECEPYITADFRLMTERTGGIIEGIKLLMKALSVSMCYIGIEDNKPEAIRALKAFESNRIAVCPLKTKYPQGGEKQLIYAITGQKTPVGGLPADIGYIVVNVATAYAVYEAVKLGKPLYERYVTVSGGAAKRPANFIVKVGTSLKELCDAVQAEGFVKVVTGGPMMGFAQANLNAAVTKGTSSVLFLTEKELRSVEPSACINCASCAEHCPMHLMPMFIDSYALAGDMEKAEKYGAMNCIECGCCAFVCPAKRPLVQSIRLAKKKIKEKNQ